MLRYENCVRLLRPITLVLAALCLLGLFSTEATDTDFWWHLKTGQYVWEHKTLPVPDPFAFSTAMQPAPTAGEAQVQHFNLTHEWLAQVLMYGVYSVGGIPAVILMRATLLAGMCGIAGVLVFVHVRSVPWGLAAAFASATLATIFTADRPALATFFLVALLCLILETRWHVWIVIPLMLLWANLHGGFFLGWIVLIAYCAEAWLAKQDDAKTLSILSACAILVSGLNPNGFSVVFTLFRYRQSALTASLIEWQHPYFWGPPYAFDALLYAALAVMLWNWRKVRIADWILFVAFGTAALTAFRNIILIGFFAPVMMARYWPEALKITIPQVIYTWAAPAMLALGLGWGLTRGEFFQMRVANQAASGAADYLQAHPRAGNLLNTYELGGYLIWRLGPSSNVSPVEKVFIDGRALSESAYRDYVKLLYNDQTNTNQLTGARVELLQRYNIQAVVMNTVEYVTGTVYPLALALGNPASSEWQLVYADAQSLIFFKNPPAGTQVYPDKAIRVVQQMEAECAAHIDRMPSQPLCARTLADLWNRSGDRNHARNLLALYLGHATEKDANAEALFQQLSQPAAAPK